MFKILNEWTCTFSPLCTRCLLLHCYVRSYCLRTRGCRFLRMPPPKNQMFSERRKLKLPAYECENSRLESNSAAWSSNIQRRQEDKHTFRSDQILILLHHSFMMSESSADVLKVAALWTLRVDTSRLGKTWKGSKPESTNVHSVLCGVDDISPEETSWISSFSSSPFPPPSVPLLSLSFIFCLSLNGKWCNDAFILLTYNLYTSFSGSNMGKIVINIYSTFRHFPDSWFDRYYCRRCSHTAPHRWRSAPVRKPWISSSAPPPKPFNKRLISFSSSVSPSSSISFSLVLHVWAQRSPLFIAGQPLPEPLLITAPHLHSITGHTLHE